MVDVLAREKIRRVTKFRRQDIANLRVALQQRAETASGEYKDVDLVTSDPKDNPIVSAALEMQAQYVVTLDARLAATEGLPGVRSPARASRVPHGILAPAGRLSFFLATDLSIRPINSVLRPPIDPVAA
jgi:hypothetical protein